MNDKRKPRNIVMWIDSLIDGKFHCPENKSDAYRIFFKRISERDNFRFAIGYASYAGGGVFKDVAKYEDGMITSSHEVFQTDVIYQYGRLAPLDFDPGNAVITNTSRFRDFCNPKIHAYEYMPEFFPKTFLVSSKDEVFENCSHISSNRIVLKPDKGSNGDDVYILNREDVQNFPESIFKNRQFLLQEFIDTSKGIPGIAKSTHDLRIITHGDKISLCHVRTPQEGSLVANSHQGADIVEVDIKKIPAYVMDFYMKVHKKITESFPKPMYSMDMALGKNGMRLLEINSHTAFPGNSFICLDTFVDNLIDHLENI